MSVLIFGENAIYTASKIAGTTIRDWAVHALCFHIRAKFGPGKNRKPNAGDMEVLAGRISRPLSLRILEVTGASKAQVGEILEEFRVAYHFGFFAPWQKERQYCVTRDPVSRFISCVSQKLGKEKFQAIRDVQHLIDDFNQICMEPLNQRAPLADYNLDWEHWQELIVPRHFVPQYFSFGDDPTYFTRRFDIAQVNAEVRPLLEEHFSLHLPEQVSNRGRRVLSLTAAQTEAVRRLYRRDYELGYC